MSHNHKILKEDVAKYLINSPIEFLILSTFLNPLATLCTMVHAVFNVSLSFHFRIKLTMVKFDWDYIPGSKE